MPAARHVTKRSLSGRDIDGFRTLGICEADPRANTDIIIRQTAAMQQDINPSPWIIIAQSLWSVVVVEVWGWGVGGWGGIGVGGVWGEGAMGHKIFHYRQLPRHRSYSMPATGKPTAR